MKEKEQIEMAQTLIANLQDYVELAKVQKKPKPIIKSDKILQICQLIGVKTFEDLQEFKKTQKQPGETTSQALERYLLEVLEG